MKPFFKRFFAFLTLLTALFCLAGCNQSVPENSFSFVPSSQESPSSASQSLNPADQFYPYHSYRFNEDGSCLMVQRYNTITFLNQQNQAVKTITLQKGDQSARFSQGDYAYSSTRICMLSSKSEQYAHVLMSESLHDDQPVYTPYNLAIWDENGCLIREFPALDTTTDGISEFDQAVGDQSVYMGYVPIRQAYWVDDNSLILCGQTHLFWYNVAEDHLSCIDDLSWVSPPGKAWA